MRSMPLAFLSSKGSSGFRSRNVCLPLSGCSDATTPTPATTKKGPFSNVWRGSLYIGPQKLLLLLHLWVIEDSFLFFLLMRLNKGSLIHRSGFRARQTQVTDFWVVFLSFSNDEILAKPPY